MILTSMRPDLPTGTVTFLFTDVEGSTRLLHELGAEAYAEALAEHRRVIRDACTAQGGVEVDTQGDAFFFAFPTAPGALSAAGVFTDALASGPIRVRVGIHTGTPFLADEGYVGEDVHRAARIAAAGHGGQVLVSASTAALAGTDGQRDLGEHRLKDLSAPERIYQLEGVAFPPLATLYRTNLPVPATPFIGRERELAEVVDLLSRDDQRLLTLTGPGGTGKTRLALQAAAEASESFPDGVYWVPFAPLRESALVLSALAQTLAVNEEPDRELQETLAEYLVGKRLLLVLDNVEHLLPEAAGPIATLRDANGSRLLVTSRERLRIGGEQTWPVPPLEHVDGTALFAARARAVDPAFTPTPVVGELCRRLEELPLAIELAAARTAVFSSEQLLERLSERLDLLKGDRDADPRQQTLRATIEWSHDLLSEAERRLFRRLAVFVGGCLYDAAEEVTDADPDTLQSLLDKSLVRKRDAAGETRYWMLETIREYAAEQLEASGEADERRRRHAGLYLARAQEAEPHLRQESMVWVDRLEREHDNIRAALDFLERTDEQELALALAASVWWLWSLNGHFEEGRRRLEAALAGETRPTAARAYALVGAGDIAGDLGDDATSIARLEEALALLRELGDEWGVAYALLGLGISHAVKDDFAGAHRMFEDSVRLFEELDDEHWSLQVSRRLAWSHERLGDLETARAIQEDILRRARASGDAALESRALAVLGQYALDAGKVDEAMPLLADAHRVQRTVQYRIPDRYSGALLVARFAMALSLEGRARPAAQLLSSFETLYEETGVHLESWVAKMNDATLKLIRGRLGADAIDEAWRQGSALSYDEAVTLALDELNAHA
jgi:predicted ATPase/class 3 adenylate cyclase